MWDAMVYGSGPWQRSAFATFGNIRRNSLLRPGFLANGYGCKEERSLQR